MKRHSTLLLLALHGPLTHAAGKVDNPAPDQVGQRCRCGVNR